MTRGRPKKQQWSEDPDVAVTQMARELAEGSFVTKALTRYIRQVLEAVYEDTIAPLIAENEELKRKIAILEGEAND